VLSASANIIVQELVRKGVSRPDCQAALESVFGESTRGRMRVNMDAVEDIDNESSSIFGTEGERVLINRGSKYDAEVPTKATAAASCQ
jgi:hypothetical protein